MTDAAPPSAPPTGDTPPPEGAAVAPPARQFAVHRVELMTPDGPIRGRVQVDMGPMRIAELVPTATELTQVLGMKAQQRVERFGMKISCRAGCGACCRQMVPVSPPEAYFIADRIARTGDLERAHLLRKFDRIEAHLASLDMVPPLLDAEVNSSPVRALNRTYFALQMPCPFLVEESCSIHADRPVACRDYNVTSPASNCRDPYTFPVEVVPMPMPLSLALARVFAELTGTEPTLIPLTLVPRWVREHPEWRERTWPGLELFQKFMTEAGGGAPEIGTSDPTDATATKAPSPDGSGEAPST